MIRYYVISTVYNEFFKQNVRDIITAKNSNDAIFLVASKYLDLGFRIVNQRVVKL